MLITQNWQYWFIYVSILCSHQKFTNTYCGSYGPALSAKKGLFPGCRTPVKNLITCGASTFPGIGIPAVAASGAFAAEKVIGTKEYNTLLKKIDLQNIQ